MINVAYVKRNGDTGCSQFTSRPEAHGYLMRAVNQALHSRFEAPVVLALIHDTITDRTHAYTVDDETGGLADVGGIE